MSRSSFERHERNVKPGLSQKKVEITSVKVAAFLPTRIKILIDTHKHINISSPIWQTAKSVPSGNPIPKK